MAAASVGLTTAQALVVIAAIAVVLSLPMLIHGPLPQGHDTLEHLNFSYYFTTQLRAGELYPRWLLGINDGLGSPSFFVYGPFPFYIMALLDPWPAGLPWKAYGVVAFLALLCSAVAAFLWLSTLADATAALAGSVLYMLMPYHLTIDFYRRSALPECWGLACIPLVLYFTARVISQKRYSIIGLAVSYALLIFSHLFSVLMFSFLPLAVALVNSEKGERLRSFCRVGFAMLLGAGLSSVYLFPALFHEQYISSARLITLPKYDWTANFLRFGRGLFVHDSETPEFMQKVSWLALCTIVPTALCGAIVAKFAPSEVRKKASFWLGVCGLTLFIMSKASWPVWRLLPRLQEIQFPWRFNALFCVVALPIFAFAVAKIPRLAGRWRLLPSAIISATAITWLLAYAAVWSRYDVRTSLQGSDSNRFVDSDPLFPAWSMPGIDEASARRASSDPRVRFREGEGSATVLTWKPRQINFRASSAAGGWVMVNQFYYPQWNAELSTSATGLELRPSLPGGLVEILVPSGNQEVRLEMPVTWAERWGRWISSLCLLTCVLSLGDLGRALGKTSPRVLEMTPQGGREFGRNGSVPTTHQQDCSPERKSNR